jgi:orotate phosphoribosyltransferase
MNQAEAHQLLEGCGAILSGHFLLTSGRHSDTYVEKARVFEHPGLTLRFAEAIAQAQPDVQAVVSPAVGAIPLGFAVAHVAAARFLFTEREDDRMAFRRGFALRRAERTLVVEDVITTGGSAAEVAELVRSAGARLLGVAALVDRSPTPPGFPLRAVIRVEARSWEAAECPLCAEGRPLTKRGSRATAATPL